MVNRGIGEGGPHGYQSIGILANVLKGVYVQLFSDESRQGIDSITVVKYIIKSKKYKYKESMHIFSIETMQTIY